MSSVFGRRSSMNVTIREVGPRDGLQNESKTLEPQQRAELIGRLGRSGLRRIEAVSFVNPTKVPQMAFAEDVISLVDVDDSIVLGGLVLNSRGYTRLESTRCREVNIAFCVTETFNRRNQGQSWGSQFSRPSP